MVVWQRVQSSLSFLRQAYLKHFRSCAQHANDLLHGQGWRLNIVRLPPFDEIPQWISPNSHLRDSMHHPTG